MLEKVKKYFWSLFLCPDSMLTFLSGAFVAVSVNICTSQIPESALTLGWRYLLAALLFFAMAAVLIWWSVVIKPFQQEYYESADLKAAQNSLDCWYYLIHKGTDVTKSAQRKLLFCFWGFCILLAMCIVVLFF